MLFSPLRDEEVEELRQRVVQPYRRAGTSDPWINIHLTGGPLDGLSPLIPVAASTNPCIGWCHVTVHGPVVAMYVRSSIPGTFVFRHYETPGTR
jgi:hypothetical protein